jgi:hypothetical protein
MAASVSLIDSVRRRGGKRWGAKVIAGYQR